MSKGSEGNPKKKENRRGGGKKYAGGTPQKYLSGAKAGYSKNKNSVHREALPKFDGTIRLNKYIANAGYCSRREADTLIASGVVTVNGEVITEMGYKVKPTDQVRFDGEVVKSEKKRYVLVNKPVDFSIKFDQDPTKKTVYQLIKNACKEQVFPVGKLDRSACGLILYTNDTDMDIKLTHPKFRVSQLFHVHLDKEMTPEDLEKLTKGMYVDDKMFSAEEASFVNGRGRDEIGVRVYSHKSNIVKLMVGKLGYKIVKLDRVEYAGLTKIDLPRGKYRLLTEKEVGFLKMS